MSCSTAATNTDVVEIIHTDRISFPLSAISHRRWRRPDSSPDPSLRESQPPPRLSLQYMTSHSPRYDASQQAKPPGRWLRFPERRVGRAVGPTPHNAEDCLRRKQPATHTFEGRTKILDAYAKFHPPDRCLRRKILSINKRQRLRH